MSNELKKLQGEIDVISKAVHKIPQEVEELQRELANLNERLPGLLVQSYLGDGRAELGKTKKRRGEILELISDMPIIRKELQTRLSMLKEELRTEEHRVARETRIPERIASLKSKLKEYNEHPWGDLALVERWVAELLELSKTEETKTFLQGLSDKDSRKIIQDCLKKHGLT